jgi:SAM-dependent methyltransferase
MDTAAYDVIARVERTHWWYTARRRILHAVVTAELGGEVATATPGDWALDLGCGTGANLEIVERCGRVIGVDFSARALRYARTRGPVEAYDALLRADAGRLPLPDGALAWAFALDIIEHLDDDARAAAELCRVLRPGGRLLVTVPAFPALWGAQDDASHHRRRYTRRALLAVLRGAGFHIRRVTYFNSALFLPIYLARRAIRLFGLPVASENTLHPGWANPLLERVFGAETHVVARHALPFGVSLLCVAERPVERPTEPSRERA